MTPSIDSPREMYCLGCAYPLRGLERRVCPECGDAFDPNDERSWSPLPFNPEHRKLGRIVVEVFMWGCLTPIILLMTVGFVMAVMMLFLEALFKLLR